METTTQKQTRENQETLFTLRAWRYCLHCAKEIEFTYPRNTPKGGKPENCPECGRLCWEAIAENLREVMGYSYGQKPISADTFEYSRKLQGLKKTKRTWEPPAKPGKVDPYEFERNSWIDRYAQEGKPAPVFGPRKAKATRKKDLEHLMFVRCFPSEKGTTAELQLLRTVQGTHYNRLKQLPSLTPNQQRTFNHVRHYVEGLHVAIRTIDAENGHHWEKTDSLELTA